MGGLLGVSGCSKRAVEVLSRVPRGERSPLVEAALWRATRAAAHEARREAVVAKRVRIDSGGGGGGVSEAEPSGCVYGMHVDVHDPPRPHPLPEYRAGELTMEAFRSMHAEPGVPCFIRGGAAMLTAGDSPFRSLEALAVALAGECMSLCLVSGVVGGESCGQAC